MNLFLHPPTTTKQEATPTHTSLKVTDISVHSSLFERILI
jgi:hypothetical protein